MTTRTPIRSACASWGRLDDAADDRGYRVAAGCGSHGVGVVLGPLDVVQLDGAGHFEDGVDVLPIVGTACFDDGVGQRTSSTWLSVVMPFSLAAMMSARKLERLPVLVAAGCVPW